MKTFMNMFVPMIKPTLKNANFAPNTLVKLNETKASKSKMININSVLLAINFDLHKKS